MLSNTNANSLSQKRAKGVLRAKGIGRLKPVPRAAMVYGQQLKINESL